jgi:hypothetical protein
MACRSPIDPVGQPRAPLFRIEYLRDQSLGDVSIMTATRTLVASLRGNQVEALPNRGTRLRASPRNQLRAHDLTVILWPLLLLGLYGRALMYSTLDNLPHYGMHGRGPEAAGNLTLPTWAAVLLLNHNSASRSSRTPQSTLAGPPRSSWGHPRQR